MPLACDAVSSEKACACGRMRASALCGLGNGAPGSPGADLFAMYRQRTDANAVCIFFMNF